MEDKSRARADEVVLITGGDSVAYVPGQEYIVKKVTSLGYQTYIFHEDIPFENARHVAGNNISEKYSSEKFEGIYYSMEEDADRKRDEWAAGLKKGDKLEVRIAYYPWGVGDIIDVSEDHDNNDYTISIYHTEASHYSISADCCALYKRATHYEYKFELGPIKFKDDPYSCPKFVSSSFDDGTEIDQSDIAHGSCVLSDTDAITIVKREKGIYFVRFKTSRNDYTQLGFREKYLASPDIKDPMFDNCVFTDTETDGAADTMMAGGGGSVLGDDDLYKLKDMLSELGKGSGVDVGTTHGGPFLATGVVDTTVTWADMPVRGDMPIGVPGDMQGGDIHVHNPYKAAYDAGMVEGTGLYVGGIDNYDHLLETPQRFDTIIKEDGDIKEFYVPRI